MSKRIGRNELIFFAVILVVGIAMMVYFYVWNKEDGGKIVITSGSVCYGTYPLSIDREIEIKNEDKEVTNILTIKDGKAKMTYASCPDKLCLHQNEVSICGENIVCLPNKVVVTVEGADDTDSLDAISQ